ncbi:MAG: cytochrome b/b6, partial [Pseudomonadota bacterium]
AASDEFTEYADAKALVDSLPATVGASIAVQKAPAFRFIHLGQILTIYYFAYFLIILPMLGLRETPKDEPESIHKAVLSNKGAPALAPAE